ncbi:Signal transduction histidine kinase [Halapricum desulfuricans]|uniref:histidine kinase n=1 Tax=Halapricum desulfuricans TaxID=2841257 RepID=A0A897NNB9_9EURY|nr:HAMP domain-containing sensor histidine kinase [Halapricum desulfuricans]QSG11716.1 Signal transduction histidine kinase [Halapricum desulfuricans]
MALDTAAIPIDAYPDPIVTYTVEDGTAVITAVNDAFSDALGPPPETLQSVFERFGQPAFDEPYERLRQGEPIRVSLDSADDPAYVVREVQEGDGSGCLVFVRLPARDTEAVSLDHVASIVSHDLRNPIDVAKAHLRAAEETGEQEHFDAVADAHDRMEHIVRDVLTLARGDDVIDASEEISIASVAEDAWRSVETRQASIAIADSLPTARADRDRARRVFENLFRNAIQHGSDGNDPPLEIRVGSLGDGFYVSDSGAGIPPDDRDAVFEAGYTTADRGTGLGLAIVRRIVDAHGWQLALTESRNGGARFEIRLSGTER